MSTLKEKLEDQIQRYQIGILECQRKLKELENDRKRKVVLPWNSSQLFERI